MTMSRKTIREERRDHVLARLPYQEWRLVGQSYFILVRRTCGNAPRKVKIMEGDEKILILAYYFTTPRGEKEILGYEIRPLRTPLSDVVGAAVFLRYGEAGPAADRYHKVQIGSEPCTLILLRCEMGISW